MFSHGLGLSCLIMYLPRWPPYNLVFLVALSLPLFLFALVHNAREGVRTYAAKAYPGLSSVWAVLEASAAAEK